MDAGREPEGVARALLDSLAGHTAILDRDGTIVAVNRAWAEFTQDHPHDPWRPQPGSSYLDACEGIAQHDSDHATALADAIRSVLSGQRKSFLVDYEWTGGAEELWFMVRVAPLEVPEGGAVVSHTDITSRKKLELQLAHQALHDPLTGLPNRTLFMDRLNVALARMERSRSAVAVLFIDLDRFKVVNDSLGHDVGDHLLESMAGRLRGALRPGDSAARFGGDEFTVLCEGINTEADAVVIAERIGNAIRRPFMLEDSETYLTSSIGVAIARSSQDRAENIVRDADAAMYRAKERGKARFELFDDTMRQRAVERLELENALHRALDREEFVLHYQPEVDLRTGKVVGVEALLRWQHPELGLLPPRDWLALADEIGLLIPLGTWVLAQACRQAVLWQAQPGLEHLRTTVNLSHRQLSQPNLYENVAKAAAETSVDPTTVGVDIKEASLSASPEGTIASLARLRSLGVAVAVDDFGVDSSNLSQLRRCPLDSLKIDPAGAGLGDSEGDEAILGALVSLGHALGVRIVGVGVETPAQLERLKGHHCDAAQGFQLGRPQPPASLEEAWEHGRPG